uniref:Amino acid transporter transmembrane domain-containing protein n=1 Tax=Timspurckia oligopyrenoides TaxID=708627 RepID=A0A7S1ESA3_9RHOD|mmetsp:Transcript_4036/g.7080  ORF Transcript_4036/g.7080 Transcript_4036/m.7080 type:complete len:470 (+) Transcript_4036:65-1474(+)
MEGVFDEKNSYYNSIDVDSLIIVDSKQEWNSFKMDKHPIQGLESILESGRNIIDKDETSILIEYSHQKRLSVTGAIINVVKLVLGSASFAIPYAFMQSGIIAGCIGMFVCAILVLFTVDLLLSARDQVQRIQSTNQNLTYASIAAVSLGPHWSSVVKVATAGSCLGACAGYVAFISGIVEDYSPFTFKQACILLLPILIALSLIRTWTHMTLWSALGNTAFACSMLAICADAFRKLREKAAVESVLLWNTSLEAMKVRWKTVLLFFGPVFFLFCFHYCVIPLEQEMKEPKQFRRIVMPVAIGLCVVFNSFIGILCFLAYGDFTQGNVIRNVSQGPLVTGICFGLAIDLLFTYCLMLAPAREYIEAHMLQKLRLYGTPARLDTHVENFVRITLVCITVAIAFAIPNFARITGIVGGFTDMFQSAVLPPLIMAALLFSKQVRTQFALLCSFIAFLATIAMFLITSQAILTP